MFITPLQPPSLACAGRPLQDMEFVQFHPTGIYGAGCLITEAVANAEEGRIRAARWRASSCGVGGT